MKRILGIDPGLANTGWAVIHGSTVIDCGVITTKASQQRDARLLHIYEELESVVDKHDMFRQHIANERLPYSAKMASASSIGEVIGVIGLLSAFFQMYRFEYSPMSAKKSAAGSGKATKEEMIKSARDAGWQGGLKEHSADAIAIAFLHQREQGWS